MDIDTAVVAETAATAVAPTAVAVPTAPTATAATAAIGPTPSAWIDASEMDPRSLAEMEEALQVLGRGNDAYVDYLETELRSAEKRRAKAKRNLDKAKDEHYRVCVATEKMLMARLGVDVDTSLPDEFRARVRELELKLLKTINQTEVLELRQDRTEHLTSVLRVVYAKYEKKPLPGKGKRSAKANAKAKAKRAAKPKPMRKPMRVAAAAAAKRTSEVVVIDGDNDEAIAKKPKLDESAAVAAVAAADAPAAVVEAAPRYPMFDENRRTLWLAPSSSETSLPRCHPTEDMLANIPMSYPTSRPRGGETQPGTALHAWSRQTNQPLLLGVFRAVVDGALPDEQFLLYVASADASGNQTSTFRRLHAKKTG